MFRFCSLLLWHSCRYRIQKMSNRKFFLFCLQAFNDQQEKPEDLTRFCDYAVGRWNYEFGVIIREMTLIYVLIKFLNLSLVPIQAYLNIPVLCHSHVACPESLTLHNAVNCTKLVWSCSLESLGWKLASDNGASFGKGRENDSEATTEPNDTNRNKINSTNLDLPASFPMVGSTCTLFLHAWITEFLDGWWSYRPLRRSCVRCWWCRASSAPYTRPT